MSIHEHLPPLARKQLKEVGWSKGIELAKLARRDRQHFDCAIWLHKARQMPTDDVKKEVEKELTGRETEPWEIIYFKLYQSQMPVIEKAIETAALMLGSNRSRRYCLGNDLCGLPRRSQSRQRRSGDSTFLDYEILQTPPDAAQGGISWKSERKSIMSSTGPEPWACGWIRWRTRVCGNRSCVAIAGVVSSAAQCRR